MKQLVKQNYLYYLIGAAIILVLKLFSKNADADALRFLLAPTSHIISLISGVPFLWEPHAGYVSHDLKFIIAASCSGINFMIVTAAMLVFSFMHRIPARRIYCFAWILMSILFSYCYTVVTNSVRILIAIYLPIYLEKQSLFGALLTPETLHTVIGTVVYFSSLLLLYPLADRLTDKMTVSTKHTFLLRSSAAVSDIFTVRIPATNTIISFDTATKTFSLIPLFWYVTLVWGIPLLTRMLRNDFAGFGNYTLIILCSCLIICMAAMLFQKLLSATYKLHSMGNSGNTLPLIKAGLTQKRSRRHE